MPMSPMADYRIYKHFTRGLSLERKRREGRSFWWLSPLGMVVASRIVARVAEMTTFKAEPKTFNVLYMKIPSQDAMRNSRNDNKHVTDLQKNEFFVETIAALTWQQARIVSHHSGSRYGENVYLLRVNQRSFKQPYNFYVQDISFICHFEPVRCGCTECLAKRGVIIQPGQNWSTRE